MRLCKCMCSCFDRFNEEIEQVKKKTNCNNKTNINWIRANCEFLCVFGSVFYCSHRLLRVGLLHFFILRVIVCECVGVLWVVWVVVVCLVSLLIYYGRIWVALSYCFHSLLPVLFCCSVYVFESCTVCVYLSCEGSSNQRPTLNKRKKVRNEPRCWSLYFFCLIVWVYVWDNFFDLPSKLCQRR